MKVLALLIGWIFAVIGVVSISISAAEWFGSSYTHFNGVPMPDTNRMRWVDYGDSILRMLPEDALLPIGIFLIVAARRRSKRKSAASLP